MLTKVFSSLKIKDCKNKNKNWSSESICPNYNNNERKKEQKCCSFSIEIYVYI